jgi:ribosomal protein L16 Arg81 hydroxylase
MTTTAEREHELTSGLTPLITDTNKRAALTKSLLQRLREECDQLKASTHTLQTDLNELRIRDNLINTLTRKFVDVMKGYQNAQQVFKVELKKKMKRQVLIVKPEATPDEIEEVLKTGGGAGEFYKTAILKVRTVAFSLSVSLSLCLRLSLSPSLSVSLSLSPTLVSPRLILLSEWCL